MSSDRILDPMRARAHAVRTKAAIRRWRYRQRNLAGGVWFHIRRVLAYAREAYVISLDDAEWLLSKGYEAETCGTRLAPEKKIFFVDSTCLSNLTSHRAIPVRLGPDFLFAAAIALVPFEESGIDGVGAPKRTP